MDKTAIELQHSVHHFHVHQGKSHLQEALRMRHVHDRLLMSPLVAIPFPPLGTKRRSPVIHAAVHGLGKETHLRCLTACDVYKCQVQRLYKDP